VETDLRTPAAQPARDVNLVPPMPELVRRAARRFGPKTAVVSAGRSASFQDVDRRSDRLANALQGLCRGGPARVAVLLPNQLEIVECDFAIAKAGMVRVPINTRLTQEEREYILADSGAEVVVYAAELAESVAVAKSVVDTLRVSISVGGTVAGSYAYEEVLASAANTIPDAGYAPDDANYMLYTSGTTGRPKGAVSTNRGRLAAMYLTLAQEQRIRPGDAIVHMASTAHGSGSKILPYFLSGAANVLEAKWDPDRLLDLVQSEGATATFMVPTMLSALTDSAESRGYRPESSSLRTITYGGAPIAPVRLARALDVLGDVLVQVYGSAEAPNPVLLLDRHDHAAARGDEPLLASAGHETLFSATRLVDDQGQDVPDGELGELWVHSPTVMSGYWNRPEATADVFRDGWYRTGDVARKDAQGYYYIVDRVRDMIISGGYNIYPAEVEAAIARFPGVAEVAVFGVPDEKWGENVQAMIVPAQGAELDPQMIIRHCQRHLAGYKKPAVVEFVDSLPLGATGKVLRRQLRDQHWAGRERRV
jgi:acyl-CoA synthetase (AMP-forming)/AMP-acid ligase II